MKSRFKRGLNLIFYRGKSLSIPRKIGAEGKFPWLPEPLEISLRQRLESEMRDHLGSRSEHGCLCFLVLIVPDLAGLSLVISREMGNLLSLCTFLRTGGMAEKHWFFPMFIGPRKHAREW